MHAVTTLVVLLGVDAFVLLPVGCGQADAGHAIGRSKHEAPLG